MLFTPPLLLAPPRITSITLHGTNTTGSGSSISLPSGINAGDLIIIFDTAIRGNSSSAVQPTGFSNIDGHVLDFIASVEGTPISYDWRWGLWYKIAVGTEGGTSISCQSGSNKFSPNTAKCAVVLRPSAKITSVSVHDAFSNDATGSTNISNTINCSGETEAVVAISTYGNLDAGFSSTSQRPFSPSPDGEVVFGPSSSIAIRWKAFGKGTTPSNITSGITSWSGRKAYQGAYLRLLA